MTVDVDILNWIDGYNPQRIPYELWIERGVKTFVRECMEILNPPGTASVYRYARVVAYFAAWAVEHGYPLDREVLFEPEMVEYYSATALQRERESGATYRSDLRRIGPLVTKRAAWTPRPPVLARRHVAPPYTDNELAALWHVVDRQNTKTLRRSGRALFLLGAGAGLDGRWVMSIRATDVQQRLGHMVIDVPPPMPRTVPVLSSYQERLLALVDEDDDLLVGSEAKGKNAASRLAMRLHLPSGVPEFSLSRLRSSWLAYHLKIGTRLPELVQAAGLQGVTVLSDLLQTIKVYPFSKYCEELEGVTSNGTGHQS